MIKTLAKIALILGFMTGLMVAGSLKAEPASKTSPTPFVQERVHLQSELQTQIDELVKRASGKDHFSGVFVRVTLEPAPATAAEATTAPADGMSLTYGPYGSSDATPTRSDLDAKFLVKMVDVDLTLDHSLPDDVQDTLVGLVNRSLADYPHQVHLQQINLVSTKDSTTADRSPASTGETKDQKAAKPEEAAAALNEKVKTWSPIALAAALVLAALTLALSFTSGLKNIGDGIRGAAAQVSASTSSTVSSAPSKSTNQRTTQSVPKTRPLPEALPRQFRWRSKTMRSTSDSSENSSKQNLSLLLKRCRPKATRICQTSDR